MPPNGIRGGGKVAGMDLHLLDAINLFRLCAENREDTNAWSEFLRRYTAKLKYFIRGALRQAAGYGRNPQNPIASGSIQELDLFQNVIVRLVENDCAAMKRFSGEAENDLLAYLAVICRSTVLDIVRRNNALKRRTSSAETEDVLRNADSAGRFSDHTGLERGILARELVNLFACTIRSHSGEVSERDQLVFRLHFFDGLSYSQISQCKGINLSKAGVEKLLKRLVDRVQILASAGGPKDTVQ
jgi:RNA polymerase sigma factor (sigma-70 family)